MSDGQVSTGTPIGSGAAAPAVSTGTPATGNSGSGAPTNAGNGGSVQGAESGGGSNNTQGNVLTGAGQQATGFSSGVDTSGFLGAGQPTPTQNLDWIPEEFRSAEWLQPALKTQNPQVEFFKQVANLQKTLGSRPVVPGENATPEQLANYRKAIGVPENVEGYELKPMTWKTEDNEIGQYLDSIHDPVVTNFMKEAALKHGLTPAQFQGMAEEYNTAMVKQNRDVLQQIEQAGQAMDTDFKSKVQQSFGNKAEQILQNGNAMLDAVLPPDHQLRIDLKQASNDEVLRLAMFADLFRQKYIKADSMGSNNTGNFVGSGGMTPQEHAEKGAQLMSHPDYRNELSKGHAAARKAVDDHYRNTPAARLAQFRR